jgi:hypothetical protein
MNISSIGETVSNFSALLLGGMRLQSGSSKTVVRPGLKTPSHFPNVKVVNTKFTFKVKRKDQLPINYLRRGMQTTGAYGLYSTKNRKLIGFIYAGFNIRAHQKSKTWINPNEVILFNLAGQPVAILRPKTPRGAWLPTNRRLIYRDRRGIEVEANALPWIPSNQGFGVIVKGYSLNARIFKVFR